MVCRLWLVLLFLLTASPDEVRADQKLSEFRRVFVATDATAAERAAADELAHYVGLIAGKKLEIVALDRHGADPRVEDGLSFFVGTAAAERGAGARLSPWKTEEYSLTSLPHGLALAGDDGPGDAWSSLTHAGSMLAVHTLLEDYLGVHWFWPGEFGEHVPIDPAATIPDLKVRQTPVFEIRSVQLGYSSYHTEMFRDASRKWARRNRLGWVRSAVFGHSWDAAFGLREGETFRRHPEWFALVNGQRRPPQMCTTHPEVIARMVEYVLAGRQDIMNISPSDGGGFCECDRCRALDIPGLLSYDGKNPQLSDRIFIYANEVARRVRERNPAKGCGMFAYTYYNRPPAKIPKLEPNLYLSFVFQSAAHRDPEALREWRDSVGGWQKLGAKMVVREGWGNHYYHDLPFLHSRQIVENMAEARRLGFISAYGEGSKNFAAMAPNYWAIAKTMWDPARDSTRLMADFYAAAYGPVAKEMEAYFASYERALDENWSKRDRVVDTAGIAYANVIGAWGRLIPRSAVDEAEGHLRAAEAGAPAGEYADRVAFHRFGQEYTRVMLALLDGYRRLAEFGVKLDTFSSVVEARREAPAERDALLRELYDLGEKREAMLLAHRDWAGPDEGLYAFTNDRKIRQWHAAVKQALGIEKPSALTKETLSVP